MAFDSCLVVGYTTQDHLLVDLDRCSYSRAKSIAITIMTEWTELGSVLLVRSSPLHYHLIFDKRVAWERLVHIIEVLADIGYVQKNYAQVRTFRRDLTLRISEKKGVDRLRPVPEPICIIHHSYTDVPSHGIRAYCHYLQIFNKKTDFYRPYGKIQ